MELGEETSIQRRFRNVPILRVLGNIAIYLLLYLAVWGFELGRLLHIALVKSLLLLLFRRRLEFLNVLLLSDGLEMGDEYLIRRGIYFVN